MSSLHVSGSIRKVRRFSARSEEEGHPVLKMLCGAYFAGIPQRPAPARLARMLRAEELDDAEAFVLSQLFAAIFPAELALLLSRGKSHRP